MKAIARLVLSLVGLGFAGLGLVAAGFFLAVMVAGDGRAGQALGQVWYQNDPFTSVLHTASLPLLGAIVERRINPLLWDPVAVTWLNWPSGPALLTAAGLFFIVAGLLFGLMRRLS